MTTGPGRIVILADIVFTTESMLVVTTLVIGLSGAVTYLFRVLLMTLTGQLRRLQSGHDQWRAIALDAVQALENTGTRGDQMSPHGPAAPVAGPSLVVGPVPPVESDAELERRRCRELLTAIKAKVEAAKYNGDLDSKG